jgi:hypothetical protein
MISWSVSPKQKQKLLPDDRPPSAAEASVPPTIYTFVICHPGIGGGIVLPILERAAPLLYLCIYAGHLIHKRCLLAALQRYPQRSPAVCAFCAFLNRPLWLGCAPRKTCLPAHCRLLLLFHVCILGHICKCFACPRLMLFRMPNDPLPPGLVVIRATCIDRHRATYAATRFFFFSKLLLQRSACGKYVKG